MKNWDEQAEKIMIERFGKDTVIALATIEDEVPYVRYVNAYYEDGAFYTITYALSNKMKHIEGNGLKMLRTLQSIIGMLMFYLHHLTVIHSMKLSLN